jgi:hypothetical protein
MFFFTFSTFFILTFSTFFAFICFSDGLECFAQAVVEALLRKVVVLEAAVAALAKDSMTDSSANSSGSSSSGGSSSSSSSDSNSSSNRNTDTELTVDTSIDIVVRILLDSLKLKATEAHFRMAMKLLLKTLRALIADPNSLSSRRLRKSTPAVTQCVLVYPDMLSLVTRQMS